jgi:hypothetical protein
MLLSALSYGLRLHTKIRQLEENEYLIIKFDHEKANLLSG